MRFQLPTFFSILIAIIIFFQVKLRWGSKYYKSEFDNFIDNEKIANSTRKKVLPPEYFTIPNLNVLPFKEDNILNKEKNLSFSKQEIVMKKSKLKMIRFEKPMSNLQLKEIFGINNFEKAIMYEEHTQMYYRALNDWASALVIENKLEDAEKVLLSCIDFGSEIFITYKLLIDIYIKENKLQKLNKLKNDIENKDFIYVNLTKTKIIDFLNYSLKQF